MGCQGSRSDFQEIGDQLTRNISEIKVQLKTQLLEAIEQDDLTQFIRLIDHNNIPINVELSQPKRFWMITHFCCRWDSYQCLQHILKIAYLQNPRNYLFYVNQQTVQGYTCLHLCGIWSSDECFNILLLYGGINLTLKDKTNTDCIGICYNYKRKQLGQILQKYGQSNIKLIQLDHQRISSKQTFNKNDNINCQLIRTKVFKKLQESSTALELIQKKKKRQAQISNIHQNLHQLYKQKNILQAQLKTKERQILIKTKKKQQSIQLQTEQKKQKQKQNVQTQLQNKILSLLRQKQEKITITKQQLIKIGKDEQKQLIKKQILKTNDFIVKNQDYLKNRTIQFREEMLKKTKDSKKSSRIVQKVLTSSKISGKLPVELTQLYRQAKCKGIFQDKQFPNSDSSIGNDQKAKKLLQELSWLRPSQFFKGKYQLFFDGIDPNDIKQGSLGVCYMLATLSTLAQNEQNIRRIFVFHDKQIGFYVLKLCLHGIVTHVVVDDYIPCNKLTKSPIFAKPVGNQLWVCLIQKAWAKCVGNYLKAESMTPNFLMQDITMAPSFGSWFKDKTLKMKDIHDHIALHHIVVLTSVSDKKIQGIVNNHAYSLLAYYENQGSNLYKIRNPWGRFQWNGQYGGKSLAWTTELKIKVGFVDADDGIFFISQSELLAAFCYYSISIILPKYQYDFAQFTTAADQNVYFTFQTSGDEQLNLRIVQKFNRMICNTNYKYSSVIFQVGRIKSNGNVQFLTEGQKACFWGAKSVHADPQIMKKYQKGKYFVRLAVQWNNQKEYNTGVFAIYSPFKKNIARLQNQEGQKLWTKLMIDFAIKKGKQALNGKIIYIMTWMKAQMICCSYIKSDEEANQLTVKWNFSPQNFKNCQLGMNHLQDKSLSYKIGKGIQNASIGTLKRMSLKQSCSSGTVKITTAER